MKLRFRLQMPRNGEDELFPTIYLYPREKLHLQHFWVLYCF